MHKMLFFLSDNFISLPHKVSDCCLCLCVCIKCAHLKLNRTNKLIDLLITSL